MEGIFSGQARKNQRKGSSLEGLQVFGHGVGFYFHKREGKGRVSLSLWEAQLSPGSLGFGVTTPKSAAPPLEPS